MILWLLFALMTTAAIFAVLWPLARRPGQRSGSDVAVYRDQLDEITRDRSAGLIGEAEAEAARIEVSRRLLSAADAADADKPASANASALLRRRRLTAVAGLVLLPIGATALYLTVGSPQLPGEPLEARMRAPHNERSISRLVAQVEAHLARNPGDARGYAVLAPVYLQLGRFADAVEARRKVLQLSGENAERQADLGEALTAQANGTVTTDAKDAFTRALALDPHERKAQFFTGVAAEQDGNHDKAAEIWRGMLKDAPADAAWAATVRQALARIGAGVPPVASAPPTSMPPIAGDTRGPSAADVAAAGQMNEKDRKTMIRGMVRRLADRLRQNGDDIEGWQRLLRAYMVLDERDKAHSAAGDARKALASDPDKLRRIEDTIRSLGLDS
jgi:cytochrome c-type biogenesis protein CcmH